MRPSVLGSWPCACALALALVLASAVAPRKAPQKEAEASKMEPRRSLLAVQVHDPEVIMDTLF